MYNQHARGMATTRHRSLVERGGRKAFVRNKIAHTQKMENKMSEENRYSMTLKKKIPAHRASSKATRLFVTK